MMQQSAHSTAGSSRPRPPRRAIWKPSAVGESGVSEECRQAFHVEHLVLGGRRAAGNGGWAAMVNRFNEMRQRLVRHPAARLLCAPVIDGGRGGDLTGTAFHVKHDAPTGSEEMRPAPLRWAPTHVTHWRGRCASAAQVKSAGWHQRRSER